MYGDTNLGANDEAILTFLKTPMNKAIFDALKSHVYPEFAAQIAAQKAATQNTVVNNVDEDADVKDSYKFNNKIIE